MTEIAKVVWKVSQKVMDRKVREETRQENIGRTGGERRINVSVIQPDLSLVITQEAKTFSKATSRPRSGDPSAEACTLGWKSASKPNS